MIAYFLIFSQIFRKIELERSFKACVCMLPHWGHGCGADKVVAFNSTSGAINVLPQSEHLKSVCPLNIVIYINVKKRPIYRWNARRSEVTCRGCVSTPR